MLEFKNNFSPRRLLVAVATCGLLATVVGCKKDSKTAHWEDAIRAADIMEKNRAAASRLQAPPLLGAIPVDTPYVFGAFEAFPDGYWKQMMDEIGPGLKESFNQIRATMAMAGEDEVGVRVVEAVLDELVDHFDAKGLEKLGFSTSPRYAFYGLGWVPVFRMEIGDAVAMRATIERVIANARVTVPTARIGGQEFWRIDGIDMDDDDDWDGLDDVDDLDDAGDTDDGDDSDDYDDHGDIDSRSGLSPAQIQVLQGAKANKGAKREDTLSIAWGVVGSEIVVTAASGAAMDLVAPVLFGGQSPGPTMADGAALKKLAADYGFAGYGVGYLDFGALAKLALGRGSGVGAQIAALSIDEQPSALCQQLIMDLTQDVPRFVGGYEEITPERFSMAMTLELTRSAAKALDSIQISLPGVTDRIPNEPMLAVGAAFDPGALQAALQRAGGRLAQVGASCDSEAFKEFSSGLAELNLLEDLPDGFRGGLLVLQGANIQGSGMPSDIEGYAVVGVNDGAALLSEMGPLVPELADLKPDGEFRKISAGPLGSFTDSVQVALKSDAVMVAVGGKSKSKLEHAMSKTSGKSPFFVMSHDAKRLNALMRKFGEAFGAGDMMGSDASYYRHAVFSMYPSDRGLLIYGRGRIK